MLGSPLDRRGPSGKNPKWDSLAGSYMSSCLRPRQDASRPCRLALSNRPLGR